MAAAVKVEVCTGIDNHTLTNVEVYVSAHESKFIPDNKQIPGGDGDKSQNSAPGISKCKSCSQYFARCKKVKCCGATYCNACIQSAYYVLWLSVLSDVLLIKSQIEQMLSMHIKI